MKKYLAALAVVFVVIAGAGGWYAFGRSRDPMAQAREYLAHDDIASATVALRVAVRNDPKNIDAHLQLAQVQMRQGDGVAAEHELKEARQLGADPALIDAPLAQAYAAQDKYKQILEEFQPDSVPEARRPAVLVLRGLAQLATQDVPGAKASIAEAARLAPQSSDPPMASARIAASQRDFATSEHDVDRALSIDPHRLDALLLKAQLLTGRGDRAGALAKLDDAVQVAPRNVTAHLQRAELLIATNADDKARPDVDAAIKIQDRNALAVYFNGVLMTRASKFADADREFTRINTVMNRMPRGYFYLAVVKASLGQNEQAIDAATRYVARAPEDPQARKLLARVQLAAQHPDRAIEALNAATGSGQNDAETQDLLGRAYAAQGRPATAVLNFEAASALAPQNTDVMARLAATRLALGDAAGATGALERSLEVAPDQSRTNEQLVVTSLAAGDTARAASALAKLRQQTGDTETTGILEGMLSMAQGNPQGGHDAFAATAQKYPNSIAARLNLARSLIVLGRGPEAEPVFAEVLAKDATNDQAFTALIGIYLQSNRVNQAITMVQTALAASPNAPVLQTTLADLYVRAGDARHALSYLDETTRGMTAIPVTLQAARARALAAAGQGPEARTAYNAILTANPNDSEARRQLIEMLAQANDFDGAKAAARDGLKLLPGNGALLETLLRIELKANGINGALALADQLRRDPVNSPAALHLKGDAYMLVQRPADAAVAYQAEYKATPSSDLAMRIANADLAANKADEGGQVLRGWVDAHTDDAPAARMAGSMELTAKRYATAEKYLEMSLVKEPNDAITLNNLAWIYQQRNDPRAKPTALHAYTRAPTADTADTLGWIMATGGDPQGGLELEQQAHLQKPTSKTIAYHLAVVLKDLGRRQEAIDTLKPILADPAEFDERADAGRLLGVLTAAP